MGIRDSNYDGIRELDNSLPPWWVYLFYITIFWGLGYLVYYHMGDWGKNQEQEYIAAIEDAEVQKAAFLSTQADLVDEKSVTILTDEASIAAVSYTHLDVYKRQVSERAAGIEPAREAWEASRLPLHHARAGFR